MRLYEIHGFSAMEEDALINEGILDSIKSAIGSRVDQHISVVRNTAQALQVLYKVGTDPKYLETAAFLLKKTANGILKALGTNPVADMIRQAVSKVWPQGRNLLDFIKTVVIVGALNLVQTLVEKARGALDAVGQAKDAAKEKVVGLILEPIKKLVSVESALDRLTSASGIFTILKSLGVADQLIFNDLTQVNKKILMTGGAA